MPHIAVDYDKSTEAPVGKWVCAPGSDLGPFDEAPTENLLQPNYCGQCVSYVKRVCPSLRNTATLNWKKGDLAKGNENIKQGTVIATFDKNDKYFGHAAVYVSQDKTALYVYDQYIYGSKPKGVGPRPLRFKAVGAVNDGDLFYIVD